jgi:hypothetical protein
MTEAPQYKRMLNVKKGQSKEGAVNVTLNVDDMMMAEKPKHVVVNT